MHRVAASRQQPRPAITGDRSSWAAVAPAPLTRDCDYRKGCRGEQIEVENHEAYMYDGEVVSKAEEMGLSGLISIRPKQVRPVLPPLLPS